LEEKVMKIRDLAGICILLLAVLGCGMFSAGDKNPNNSPRAAPSPSADTAKNGTRDSDAPKETINPDNLDPDTPLPVDLVIHAMLADPKAWEGKEILVKGKIDGATTSDLFDGVKAVSQAVENLDGKVVMNCYNQYPPGKLTEKPLFTGHHVFKGKVARIDTQYKEFKMEPCEIQENK
jgi:hypothetical protein